ncbi:MAG: M23 family metallopeptidase [Pseudomonadota bacterium]
MKIRVLMLAALVLTACQIPPVGLSTAYVRPAEPIDVVMPPNAPSIRQQFTPPPSRDRYAEGHYGIDVVGPLDAPILAPAPGRVVASFVEPIYGGQIIMEHGPDATGRMYRTRYAHLKSRVVRRGDVVARGQRIGGLGRGGITAGGILHLHFEVQQQQSSGRFEPLDPHLFWVDGIGRVTCFEPGRSYPDQPFAITYPAQCL